MPNIKSKEDITEYREHFGDFWSSATLRIATIELDDGTLIPNGEVVFSPEPKENKRTIRYEKDRFRIYEIISSSPFGMLEDIVAGTIPTTTEPIQINTEINQHDPGRYFQTGLDPSRVHEDRPATEINAVIDLDIPEPLEDQYTDRRKELDDLLKSAQEPYYDTGRCQDYYFECIFAKRAHEPKILLFADLDIDYGLEGDTLTIRSRECFVEELFVTVLPQRPFGQHKGRRLELSRDHWMKRPDGIHQFSRELDLEGIEHIYVNFFLKDTRIDMIRYTPTDASKSNPRWRILREYDQRDLMTSYLAGKEPSAFEMAVLNLLSTAGYQVQTYGEGQFSIPNYSNEDSRRKLKEIDIIAYSPDGSEILFVECTNANISEKEGLLDRAQAIAAHALQDEQNNLHESPKTMPLRNVIPCIATPQSSDSLNEGIVEGLEEKGVEILHQERLKNIYEASADIDNTVSINPEVYEVI